eukprot:CAMPEP_0204370074 /NCGR_PEP_ID=MMETSP0469-20131031/45456_1 /ASSEMBLY_ACC=CAM_ASM_000384 /TAXON_ID=2969 /ORGANISM="Oxyrrhis marina" /LENGTH=163 /DNA_ID=CAMNT_0051359935 /DNA_START=45 /DNA_END=536 /DNA_ORIENTATION=+
MQPWAEDFKHRVVAWHYDFYMGPKAEKAIRRDQEAAPQLQRSHDIAKNGVSTKNLFDARSPAAPHELMQGHPSEPSDTPEFARRGDRLFSARNTKYFRWQTFIPNMTPSHASSNPFCARSQNQTGWIEHVKQSKKIARDPRPLGQKHIVSGTDDSVPVFPKFK